ncbi:Protein GrpE [bacterium HR18]|mgnify:CR=1 FL=1|uniref:Protein GrpE n=1 Tax=Rhodothermus marinus TaxID=29549 RepID=A0A7V2AZZ9_RHOMR|nr:Protein GrpE [bacterium HR18]
MEPKDVQSPQTHTEPPLESQLSDTTAPGSLSEETSALTARIQQLEAELAQLQDKFLRTAAELQNYRRRVEQEKQQLLELGKAAALRPLLDVLDDLERSLAAAQQTEGQDVETVLRQLREGVSLVYRKFLDELARLGVQPIEATGKPFDPILHEALLQQPAPEGAVPGTVLEEIQKGYLLGERVLRHSRVVVAAPPDGKEQPVS